MIRYATVFVTALVGPMLVLYMASDRLFDESYAAQLLHYTPIPFYAAAIIGYTAAIGVARGNVGLLRSGLAILAAIFLHIGGWLVTWPLQFGIGDISPKESGVIALAILAAVIAVFPGFIHHIVLRSGVPAKAEIPAHLFAMSSLVLILGFFVPDPKSELFSAWPAVVAAIPFAAIAIIYADRSIHFGHAMLGVALAAAPVYFVKAWSDHVVGRGEPLTWPSRVSREFLTPSERNALIRRVTRVRKDQPVRIGQHWYKFDNAGIQNPHTNNSPRPDRIQSLMLSVPAEDLGLPYSLGQSYGYPPGRIVIWIGARTKQPPRRPANTSIRVYTHHEDLVISILRRLGAPDWPADNVLEERMQTYIKSHRASPPVGTK